MQPQFLRDQLHNGWMDAPEQTGSLIFVRLNGILTFNQMAKNNDIYKLKFHTLQTAPINLWRQKQYVTLKHWYLLTSLHCITTQKTNINLFLVLRVAYIYIRIYVFVYILFHNGGEVCTYPGLVAQTMFGFGPCWNDSNQMTYRRFWAF
jgi:hypothetical protein